jgi:hypothetical protein
MAVERLIMFATTTYKQPDIRPFHLAVIAGLAATVAGTPAPSSDAGNLRVAVVVGTAVVSKL